MTISLPDARQLSDDILDAFRLRAIHGHTLGYTEAQLAELLGVARETVSRWCAAYRTGGHDALPGKRTGRPLGSGRELSDEQAQHVQQILDTQSPEQHNIPAALWTRRAVRDLIHQECGVLLAVRTVGTCLARWGYTSKRPQRRAYNQDPEEVQEWLDTTYPDLENKAETENAEIFWCDETGAVADAFSGTGYAKIGHPATVEVPPPHIRMNTISAISNTGAVRFMTYTQTMTAVLFIVFLGRLLRSTTGKIYLIVDRLKVHQSAAVTAWVAGHADRLELVYLPRSAPERNVDEYLNNDLKGPINAEGLSKNQSELRSRIQAFLRKLAHFPDHVRSYFQAPLVQYASADNM